MQEGPTSTKESVIEPNRDTTSPVNYEMPQKFILQHFYWNSPATFEAVQLTSTVLGILVGIGLVNAINFCWGYPQFWLYLSFYCLFHLTEFWVTAHYNKTRVSMASFLLANGWEYLAATTTSILEALTTHYFAPSRHSLGPSTILALVIIFAGQYIRTKAMIHAAQSFNHQVQFTKNEDHELITSGIYGKMRHPSYCGYYLWTIGTQLLLGNIFCSLAFSVVLWLFFKSRIGREEAALVRFFGQKYTTYQSAVWSGLPFI